MSKAINILDEKMSYASIDNRDIALLINASREGISYMLFNRIVDKSPFTIQEWSDFLHLSERTLQRYKKVKRTFDALQSEKILQIILLYRFGIEVFGTKEKFDQWLEVKNIALGQIMPKELLDNAFGISFLKDELMRIEHGVLA